MKNYIITGLLCLIVANQLQAQQPQQSGESVILTKPDLVGKTSQNGHQLVVTVSNLAIKNPHNGSGKAPTSKATLKMGTQTQAIAVPQLDHEASFTKTINIPSSLLDQAFTATLKVDDPGSINEANENNNVYTQKFNECDLMVVKQADGTLALSWNDAKPGIITFKIKNNGARKSPASVARVLVIQEGQINKAIQNVSIPAINGGAMVTLEFKFAGSKCKTYFDVECDPNNKIAESEEGNNKAGIKITCEK